MPKAKTREELDKQIADTKNEIRQSENLLKEQIQKNHKQERNDRTHRLIEQYLERRKQDDHGHGEGCFWERCNKVAGCNCDQCH